MTFVLVGFDACCIGSMANTRFTFLHLGFGVTGAWAIYDLFSFYFIIFEFQNWYTFSLIENLYYYRLMIINVMGLFWLLILTIICHSRFIFPLIFNYYKFFFLNPSADWGGCEKAIVPAVNFIWKHNMSNFMQLKKYYSKK